jgi:hypothetical protein
MFMDNSEFVGSVVRQFTTDGRVSIARNGDETYFIESPRKKTVEGDCINVNGAASGMAPGSYMEFSGTRTKRVAEVVTPAGKTYVYVEIGENE